MADQLRLPLIDDQRFAAGPVAEGPRAARPLTLLELAVVLLADAFALNVTRVLSVRAPIAKQLPAGGGAQVHHALLVSSNKVGTGRQADVIEPQPFAVAPEQPGVDRRSHGSSLPRAEIVPHRSAFDKSDGPKISVSARSEAPAISWMFFRPAAVSIWSSSPIRLSTPLVRTTTVLPVQSPSLRAWTTLPRASSLAPGATESSRSMNTSSAGRPGALASIFGEEPGTDRHERRGLVTRVAAVGRVVMAGVPFVQLVQRIERAPARRIPAKARAYRRRRCRRRIDRRMDEREDPSCAS